MRQVRPSRPASTRSLSTPGLKLVYTHGLLSFLFLPRRRPCIYRQPPPDQSRDIGSRSCVPMAFTAARVCLHGASCPQCSSSNGWCCLLTYHHGPMNVRLIFPTPTDCIDDKRSWACTILTTVSEAVGKQLVSQNTSNSIQREYPLIHIPCYVRKV